MSSPKDRTDAELVEMIAAYGDDHGDRTELHRRHTHLEGWFNAAQYLQKRHIDEYWEARGGFDPWSSEYPGTPESYKILMAVYGEQLQKLLQS